MGSPKQCLAHEDTPSIAFCEACDRGLCGECWHYTVDGKAWCTHCVAVLRRPLSPLVPMTLVTLAALALALFLRTTSLQSGVAWLICATLAALRRVANDTHGCQGSLRLATGWGVLWASVYTLPMAAVVGWVQWLLRASAG